VAALEKLDPDCSRWSSREWTVSAKWAMASDPATNPVRTLLGPSMWFAPGMRLIDMHHMMKAMEFAQECLYREFPSLTALSAGTRYSMPFYIFQGERDVLTPPRDAAAFLERIDAPVKEMALIEGAGHFAAFTHPQRFLELMRGVTSRDGVGGEWGRG
jgi:proline iminopeptidase